MIVLKPSKNKQTGGYSPDHKGYDHSGKGDLNYYSSFFGKVVQAKNSETKNWTNKGKPTNNDYGNYIKIKGEVDGEVVYQLGAHFQPGTVLPKGTEVKRGQVIAQVGNTGNSTARHSHTEYRDGDDKNFSVDFTETEEEVKPDMQSKEQIIIDSYFATTGEYPGEDEKKARIQKNENTSELIYDLLNGDGRSKPRWLEIWEVNQSDATLMKKIEEYQETIQKIKELLKIRVGDNSEDILGEITGLLERISELEDAQIPKVVYKYEDKDYEKIIKFLNLLVIQEK